MTILYENNYIQTNSPHYLLQQAVKVLLCSQAMKGHITNQFHNRLRASNKLRFSEKRKKKKKREENIILAGTKT